MLQLETVVTADPLQM